MELVIPFLAIGACFALLGNMLGKDWMLVVGGLFLLLTCTCPVIAI